MQMVVSTPLFNIKNRMTAFFWSQSSNIQVELVICIISNSCQILAVDNQNVFAYLSQSGFLPLPLFSMNDQQFIIQFAEHVIGCQLLFKKQLHSVKRKEKAQVGLLSTHLLQATKTSLWQMEFLHECHGDAGTICLHTSLLPLALCVSCLCVYCVYSISSRAFSPLPLHVIDCVTCHLPAQLL